MIYVHIYLIQSTDDDHPFLGLSELLLFNAILAIFSNTMARTSYIRWDDNDLRFVLDQHA